MNYRKSSIGLSIDKLIHTHFDSKLSKIEAKYPFEKNIVLVSGDRFEKRKARIINIIAVACMALFFGFSAILNDPPRQLERGIVNYYDKHDLGIRIPEAIDSIKEILNKYKN